MAWALRNEWDRVATHALGTVFESAAAPAPGGPKDLIFVYNPTDPFLSTPDVHRAAALGREVGLAVREVQLGVDHVKALFQRESARTIFELLDAPRPPPARLVTLRAPGDPPGEEAAAARPAAAAAAAAAARPGRHEPGSSRCPPSRRRRRRAVVVERAHRANGRCMAVALAAARGTGLPVVYTLDSGFIFTCAYISTLPLFLGARARSHDRQQLVELVHFLGVRGPRMARRLQPRCQY